MSKPIKGGYRIITLVQEFDTTITTLEETEDVELIIDLAKSYFENDEEIKPLYFKFQNTMEGVWVHTLATLELSGSMISILLSYNGYNIRIAITNSYEISVSVTEL